MTEILDWLSFREHNKVSVKSGKVELGQGISTALAQISADELALSLDIVKLEATRTGDSPDQGFTAGSWTIETSGDLRSACRGAREALIEYAKKKTGLNDEELRLEEGHVYTNDGAWVSSYWSLDSEGHFETLKLSASEGQASIPRFVGQSVSRRDIIPKVTGAFTFLHDLEMPGMLHARIVRPHAFHAALEEVDASAIRELQGVVDVIVENSFVAVIADDEVLASKAADLLDQTTSWRTSVSIPHGESFRREFKEQQFISSSVFSKGDASGEAPMDLERSYTRPFLAHGSIAPSVAIAIWEEASLRVWTHSQGIYPLRREIAMMLDLSEDQITVEHVESAGCYGHNGADDAALEASIIATRIPSRPIRLQWTRQEELGWSPLGTLQEARLAAKLDTEGRILSWRHDVWSCGHTRRPGLREYPVLLAAESTGKASERASSIDPPLSAGGGAERNSIPIYDFPVVSVKKHLLQNAPLRTSSIRALGAYLNVFAIEAFMDEISHSLGIDPVDFRLSHLIDERAKAVIELCVEMANWRNHKRQDSTGLGFGFARYSGTSAYCAAIAEIVAEDDVTVKRLTLAVDAGTVVNPDGLKNQIEGGAIQSASWSLLEEVQFDANAITSNTWTTYPIIDFSRAPAVEVHVVDSSAPSLGVGEAAQGPVAAAIANGLYDAIGVRVRDLPLTPDRVMAAIEAEDN